jgi:hypothetical protein
MVQALTNSLMLARLPVPSAQLALSVHLQVLPQLCANKDSTLKLEIVNANYALLDIGARKCLRLLLNAKMGSMLWKDLVIALYAHWDSIVLQKLNFLLLVQVELIQYKDLLNA